MVSTCSARLHLKSQEFEQACCGMVSIAEVVVTVKVVCLSTSGFANTMDILGHPGCWYVVTLIYRHHFTWAMPVLIIY